MAGADDRRRTAAIKALRAGMACARCGEPDDGKDGGYARMHWHHIDPATKSLEVSSAPSVEAAKAEIAKCELLCLRCHARHHATLRASCAPVGP